MTGLMRVWCAAIGAGATLLALPLAGYLALRSGYVPMAIPTRPLPLERYLAKTALHAELRRAAPRRSPFPATARAIESGAIIYRRNCAFCHGLPGRKTEAAARGMYPPPPQFFHPGAMVTTDPVGWSYWKAKYGIRLTGMPGFHASLSDRQLWDVVQMLRRADRLPAPAKALLLASPVQRAEPGS